MNAHTAAVIVPIYKNQLSEYEQIALRRCFEVFSKEHIIAVKPEKLDLSGVSDKYPFSEVRAFNDSYFENISGYNKLMTAEEFYGSFLTFDYILVYQLDAFVFRNDLDFWTSQGYDYIGAPWLWNTGKKNLLRELKHQLITSYHVFFNTRDKETGVPIEKQFRDRVGNGGFSLRRVRSFYDIIRESQELIDFYNANNKKHHYFNEDVFWGLEVNRKRKRLNIPSYKVAVNFAFENGLQRAERITKGALPFGCHDWDRNLEFWRPRFKTVGYEV